MKRNVLDCGSSDSDTETPPKRVKLFTEPNPEGLFLCGSDLSSAEFYEDYTKMKFEEPGSHAPQSVLDPKDKSLLENNSIGLSIMQKMGFKVGQTLGKDNTGISEPITVKVKKDRFGIGATRNLPQGTTLATINNLRSHSKHKDEERRDRACLQKLQKYCYQRSGEDMDVLDRKISLTQVNEYWRSYAVETSCKKPKRVKLFGDPEPKNDTATELFEPLDFDLQPLSFQLDLLTTYARKHFLYCPHCGINFENEQDMQENCPGPSAQDHAV